MKKKIHGVRRVRRRPRYTLGDGEIRRTNRGRLLKMSREVK